MMSSLWKTRIMFVMWMVCFIFLPTAIVANYSSSELTLAIMHINDLHSNFDGIRKDDAICRESDKSRGLCFGGVARISTKVKEIRTIYGNTLLLSAGDNFQGTLWYTMLKWRPVVKFLNMLNFSAMSLGNHEFDDGVGGLVPFLDQTNSPILCANMDVSKENKMKGTIKKSIVKEFEGYKVGIIGYLTPDTKFLSYPGDTVAILNVIDSIRSEAQSLKKKGVSIIIALGHAGFSTDKKIAKEISEVDIVVGGHTNTFLYNGIPPSSPEPVDTYPVVIYRNNNSSPALVVQSYAFGKYLGFLNVKFDSFGDVKYWSGNPILLRPSIKRDETVVAAMEPFHEILQNVKSIVVGSSLIRLNGSREICRKKECSMGSFLADVYLDYFQKLQNNETSSILLSLINGGGVRSSVEPGNVTFSDIYSVIPFEDNIEMIPIKGSKLYEAFEHSVMKYDLSGLDLHGSFLQVSGFKIIYDVHAPAGHRVAELLAKHNQSYYEHVKTDKVYNVVTTGYLLSGGDDYQMLNATKRNPLAAFKDSEIVKIYFEENSPIKCVESNRIRFLHDIIEKIN